jgi:hypothetical protein
MGRPPPAWRPTPAAVSPNAAICAVRRAWSTGCSINRPRRVPAESGLPMKTPLLCFALAVATALAAGGCFSLPEGQNPDLSTPELALEFLENSYNGYNPGGVQFLLDEEFVFYFNENEVGDIVDGHVMPGSWNNYDEVRCSEKLLDTDNAVFLNLETAGAPPGQGDYVESDWLYYSLDVSDADGNNYHAEGQAKFAFARDADKGWLIRTWFDYALPATPYSWSTLKLLFRYR